MLGMDVMLDFTNLSPCDLRWQPVVSVQPSRSHGAPAPRRAALICDGTYPPVQSSILVEHRQGSNEL